ncbi:DcuS/MalK family sensor histidine kinase [Bacillus sp. REN10]|uniref:DcuS/MalK family sensor histidine kinase n=1 Tax=Bacillus sp. REN10 TaxID=2782541 RepID=UPI00193AF281|nr:DcuS/MalK family sensor histidine kinase [Bacillus sp. REN10]
MNIRKKWTLRSLIVGLVVLVVVLALAITNGLIAHQTTEKTRAHIEKTVTMTSRLVADSAVIHNGLLHKEKESDIQPYVEHVRKQLHVDFITVFDERGVRKSHPNRQKIGQVFQGEDVDQALHGEECLSIAEGSLGKSLRYFTPVFDEKGRQIGGVAVGKTLENIQLDIRHDQQVIYVGLSAGLLVGVGGALYLGRRVRKVMFGLEPMEIARLLEERDILIESTHEGIIAVDSQGVVTLMNEAAVRLLEKAGVSGPFIGYQEPRMNLGQTLTNGQAIVDEEVEVNGVVFFVNRSPLYVDDQIIGAVATIRDKTEVKKLAERLSGTEMYAEALRAQTHEFMNRLHVILGMVQMKRYDALPAYIEELNVRYQDSIGYLSRRIQDPVIAGFLLAKISYCHEQEKELTLMEDSFMPNVLSPSLTHDLITIIGNLVDNALEATPKHGRPVTLFLGCEDHMITIEVKDHGKGIANVDEVFMKGISDKGKGHGFGLYLVQETIQELQGEIHVTSEKDKGTIIEVNIPMRKEGKER